MSLLTWFKRTEPELPPTLFVPAGDERYPEEWRKKFAKVCAKEGHVVRVTSRTRRGPTAMCCDRCGAAKFVARMAGWTSGWTYDYWRG